MRVRKKAWTVAEYENNIHICHESEKYKGKWNELFGNGNPIYVEIGCGKGRFISQMAAQNSDINFIGIERQSTIVATAARNLGNNAKNVYLIHGDVENLADFFEVGEIKRLYINFCDPWPKKKWIKRRLTHRNFLEKYKAVFGDKAEIFFKTDNRILFEFSLNEFCADDWKLSNISLDLHNSDYEGNIMTEYEEKFSEKGFPIYRLEARWEKN
ncbi:MAG: tRNA (guanosine(46)-N7)-methyltransferase TrmB [Clostridia bacterium]|jgi:tRNA (guanine-N7-)-methyltransferase|nr:tRNA (guanosine(46)-N7)-methyltransferase TrmB [Clostridia bacterium]MCI2015272.1 tRNA (guanosine(46)-N7)-methyltransferase TrmB [Clostridia bacterium]